MSARRRGRELALQALYQVALRADEPPEAVDEFWEHCEASTTARDFARELVQGVLGERGRIDALIAASAEHWRIGRLSHVDLGILRVATYELLCCREVPTSVAIDEAIEIAKRFGTGDSPTFVNGVLDQVAALVAKNATTAATVEDPGSR